MTGAEKDMCLSNCEALDCASFQNSLCHHWMGESLIHESSRTRLGASFDEVPRARSIGMIYAAGNGSTS